MTDSNNTADNGIGEFTFNFTDNTFDDNVIFLLASLGYKRPAENIVCSFFTDISLKPHSNKLGKEKSALIVELVSTFEKPSLAEVKELAKAYFGDLWSPNHIGFIGDLYSAKGLTVILNNNRVFTFID